MPQVALDAVTGTEVAKVDVGEGSLINFKKDDNGNVKELQFFNTNATPKGSFSHSTSTLKAGDSYLDGKKLLFKHSSIYC